MEMLYCETSKIGLHWRMLFFLDRRGSNTVLNLDRHFLLEFQHDRRALSFDGRIL
jgi:hypothetical protein